MQAFTITIPIYAESREQADNLVKVFYQFVAEKRTQGIAVTADKFAEALLRFKDNIYLLNYFKNG